MLFSNSRILLIIRLSLFNLNSFAFPMVLVIIITPFTNIDGSFLLMVLLFMPVRSAISCCIKSFNG